MTCPRRAALAVTLAVLVPAAPRAQESVLDQPIDKEGWPTEITSRPLTLARGMGEVTVPLGIGLTKDRAGKPTLLSPSVYYGVSDTLTVGIRTFQGLCFSGAPSCPKVFNDLSIDTLWRLWRGASTDLAAGVALNASPLTDPFMLAAEVRMVGRFRGGPLSLTVAPGLEVGLTERDADVAHGQPLAFPLATTTFGFFQPVPGNGVPLVPGNKEFLRIPATLAVQATPSVALAVATSLDGPLDPPTGSFSDYYSVPLGGALVLSPSNMLDLGVSFTFLNLAGKQRGQLDGVDQRAMQVFVSGRR